ncbi:hypothetical protein SESBI_04310 [Sesbania bispinosa]|nr:hypothetical protein SESBI_04310 [Sesbania bispinosa]
MCDGSHGRRGGVRGEGAKPVTCATGMRATNHGPSFQVVEHHTAEPPSIFHHADIEEVEVLALASSKGHNDSGGAPSHDRDNGGASCATAGETLQRCNREALQEQVEENEQTGWRW